MWWYKAATPALEDQEFKVNQLCQHSRSCEGQPGRVLGYRMLASTQKHLGLSYGLFFL